MNVSDSAAYVVILGSGVRGEERKRKSTRCIATVKTKHSTGESWETAALPVHVIGLCEVGSTGHSQLIKFSSSEDDGTHVMQRVASITIDRYSYCAVDLTFGNHSRSYAMRSPGRDWSGFGQLHMCCPALGRLRMSAQNVPCMARILWFACLPRMLSRIRLQSALPLRQRSLSGFRPQCILLELYMLKGNICLIPLLKTTNVNSERNV